MALTLNTVLVTSPLLFIFCQNLQEDASKCAARHRIARRNTVASRFQSAANPLARLPFECWRSPLQRRRRRNKRVEHCVHSHARNIHIPAASSWSGAAPPSIPPLHAAFIYLYIFINPPPPPPHFFLFNLQRLKMAQARSCLLFIESSKGTRWLRSSASVCMSSL